MPFKFCVAVHTVARWAEPVLPRDAPPVGACACTCKNLKLFGTIRPDAGPNEYGPPVTALAKLKPHTRARTHTITRAQDILK